MRSFLIFFTALFSHSIYSQITVESNTLPKVGDVLIYQDFAAYEDTLAYQENGEDVRWEIGRINITGRSEEAYLDISTTELADSFPEANMILDLGGFQAAAERNPNSIDVIGFSTAGFGGFGIDAAIDFVSKYTLRQTPLTYGSQYDDDFEVIFTIAASELPFLDSLDLGGTGVNGLIESIRVTTTVSKSEEVIGWGTLSLWGTEKEVLKVEQIDNSETLIEIGVNVLGFTVWINAGDLLGEDMGGGFGGIQSSITYKFITDDLQTSVIEFTENRLQDSLGGANFLSVTGRVSGDIMSGTENLTFDEGGISLFPNPSADMITLSSRDAELGTEWQVDVMSLDGQKVLSKPSYILGKRMDISELESGHYVLRVIADKKNYLSKMTIIK